MVNWSGIKEKAAAKPAAENKVISFDEALEKYKDYIKRDFKRWNMACSRTNDTDFQKEHREKSMKAFNDGLIHEVGKKYIKIVKTDNQRSVHSFVVNTHDDKKFKYGDILKAASWSAPARNFPRGNVFESDRFASGRIDISWCGA